MTSVIPPTTPGTGTTPPTTPTAPTTTGGVVPPITGTDQSLASWVGPYVTDMLGKTQAVANTPYAVYDGPLTAGQSTLQGQAFQGIGALPTAYTGTKFDTGLGAVQSVQGYMNPYQQNVTDVALREARRQSDIGRLDDSTRLTKAGAFGGSRQAIMDAERDRNLGTRLNDIQYTGSRDAYDRAMTQRLGESDRYMTSQTNTEDSRQYGSKYGLDALGAQLKAGEIQRGIESEGITADHNEFLAQRDHPMAMLQFMQSMLQGMPVSANNNAYAEESSLTEGANTVGGLLNILKMMYPTMFETTPATTPPTTPTTTPPPTPAGIDAI